MKRYFPVFLFLFLLIPSSSWATAVGCRFQVYSYSVSGTPTEGYGQITFNCTSSTATGWAVTQTHEVFWQEFLCTDTGWVFNRSGGGSGAHMNTYEPHPDYMFKHSAPAYSQQYILDNILPECEYVDTCPAERAAAIATCPFGFGNYDCPTEILDCAIDNCGDVFLEMSQQNHCGENAGYCFGTSYPLDWGCCPQRESEWGIANCAPQGMAIATYDCYSNTGTCKDATCSSYLDDCVSQCSGEIENFECVEIDNAPVIITPCSCTLGEQVGPDPDGEHGESENDTPEPDPLNTDSENLASIAHSNQNIETNTTITNNILDAELNEIAASVNESNIKLKELTVISSKLDQTNSNLNDIKDELSGTYIAENISNDYSLNSNLEDVSEFTTRFSGFIDDIKATPLFSLPDQVLFNIPNSSESIYTIDMGQYGTTDIDLADYANVLLILRSAFLVCFSYAALRIVVSKR
ncbi:MAG: hypothetical protein KKA70_10710 [Proteobacteria bacterium]|nr:hypothetical protein [Pseudomonadota bacterium]